MLIDILGLPGSTRSNALSGIPAPVTFPSFYFVISSLHDPHAH